MILIIGSNGFIGNGLVEYYLNNNKTVIGCDVNLPKISRDDVNFYLLNPDNPDYTTIFKCESIDYCINCAGSADVGNSFLNPARDFTLNVANLFKILDVIRINAPKCKLINLSSSAVYGECLNDRSGPSNERKVSPISPYGIHKSISELICSEYHTMFKLNTCSLRLFSAYGIGLRRQLFWDLYNKCLRNETQYLFGDGNEIRDFINIVDLVRVIDICLNNADYHGETIDVGNGVGVSIAEVVSQFKDVMGKEDLFFNGSKRIGDPIGLVANSDQIKSWGYKQQKSLVQGVKEYIKWLEELV